MNNLEDIIKELNPTYETVLPISRQTVTFVPFKVKDAKNISIILKEQNKKLCLMAMVNILKNNSKGVIIEDLCLADAEYLFIKIRSKSVGEELNLKLKDEPINILIDNIKVRNEITNKNLKIKDGVYATIQTPTIKKLLNCDFDNEISVLKKYIKTIVIKNEIYNLDSFITDELNKLIDNLPFSFINEIKEIAANQPELYINVQTKEGEREVSGTLNFFTSLQIL